MTQAVAEAAPIQVLQLFVQHLCPPVKVNDIGIHSVNSGDPLFFLLFLASWKSIPAFMHSF